jgi:protein gp37
MRLTKIVWAKTLLPGGREIPGYSSNPIRARNRLTGKTGWACIKESPGCANCHAEMINKVYGTGLDYTAANFANVDLFVDEKELHRIASARGRRSILMGDMLDLFLPGMPGAFMEQIWRTIVANPRHIYKLLTKHPDAMQKFMAGAGKEMLENVWLGVTVENQEQADARIPILMQTPAAVRFLSIEPLLGPIDLQATIRKVHLFEPNKTIGDLHQIIVGGESGLGARPMDLSWARLLRSQCHVASIPFFMKQMGAVWAKEHESADKKGGCMPEWPYALRIQEWPL